MTTPSQPEFVCPKLWWAIGFFGVALICFLSLTRLPPPPMDLPQGFDKWEHLSAYAVLGAYFAQLARNRRLLRLYLLVLWLLGAALEVLQSFTDYRSLDFFDLIANTLGLSLAAVIGLSTAANWLRQLDAWWFARRRH